MSDIKGFIYAGKGRDETANNGLGADIAHFVVVHEGREAEADSLAKAFKDKAARGSLRVRKGVIQWRADQVDSQIKKLKSLPDMADTLSQLLCAQAELQGKKASPSFSAKAGRNAETTSAPRRKRPEAGLKA